MDTKTKKPAKKPAKKTPKQAIARINSLLKGIDNSVLVINKHKTVLNDAVKEARSLMGGLSNLQAAPAKKPEAKKPEAKKPAPAKKPALAKKPVKKTEIKKPAPAKKPVKKTEIKKPAPEKSVPAKPGKPVEGRPSLKEAVKQIIVAGGNPMTAADIWKQATAKWGYWSRQSLYNVLKDEKSFSRAGEKFSMSRSTVDDAEADKFVQQVESNTVVSNVQ